MRAILTYHSIDPSGSVISVDPAAFRRHAEWLASSGPPVVPVSRLLELPGESEAIALTFDDAFENFGDVAWPILAEHELPATVFVVSERTGTTNDWRGVPEPEIPSLPLLDWGALGRLAEAGVEIGSHTCRHAALAGAGPGVLADELGRSADRIESEIGVRPRGLAYPYGSHDDDAVDAAGRVYDWACTTELAPVSAEDSPHRLPRLDAFYLRRPGQLEAWGTPWFRARLSVRRAARRARRHLRPPREA